MYTRVPSFTKPLHNIKLSISRSYQILVLTTVLVRPRHTAAENGVKYYQGPTACDYDLNLWRYLNPEFPQRATAHLCIL